jgi:hypothetical protein
LACVGQIAIVDVDRAWFVLGDRLTARRALFAANQFALAALAGLLAGALTARQLVLLVGIGQLLAFAPLLGKRARRWPDGAAAEVSFIG